MSLIVLKQALALTCFLVIVFGMGIAYCTLVIPPSSPRYICYKGAIAAFVLYYPGFLLLLPMADKSVPLCDHYKLINGKRICVPIKEFKMKETDLDKTVIESPFKGTIYDLDDNRIGSVEVSVVKSDHAYLVIHLPDNTAKKLVKLANGDDIVTQLKLFSGNHLWKTPLIKFKYTTKK